MSVTSVILTLLRLYSSTTFFTFMGPQCFLGFLGSLIWKLCHKSSVAGKQIYIHCHSHNGYKEDPPNLFQLAASLTLLHVCKINNNIVIIVTDSTVNF